MATQVIRIVVTESGSRKAGDSVANVGKQAKQASSAVTLFRRTLGAIGAAVLIKGLIGISDAFISIENRLKTVTPSLGDARFAMQQLIAISKDTRADFQSTAETFARLESSSKNLGFSQQTLLGVTSSLNQAIVLSGSTAREARTALIQ